MSWLLLLSERQRDCENERVTMLTVGLEPPGKLSDYQMHDTVSSAVSQLHPQPPKKKKEDLIARTSQTPLKPGSRADCALELYWAGSPRRRKGLRVMP
jgi:hypothetical protein